jgi:uncharacterized protein YkwD
MRASLRLAPFLFAAVILIGCSTGSGGGLFSAPLKTKAGTVDAFAAAAMISSYRASRGLGPVRVNATLNKIAATHAKKMASSNKMAHVLPGQGSFKKRIADGGYKAVLVAENVGAGYGSLESAIQRWKNSPSHDKNLLNPQIKEIGIAVAYAPESRYQSYWALVMADPYTVPVSALDQTGGDLMLALR